MRMSTDRQLRGDSLRRQCEISTRYAAENGLDLEVGFRFEDIGISAFKGANADTGALGAFLRCVNGGEIKPGSYLLVESLDRISRQGIMDSLPLFMRISQSGINIVTLADRFVYETGKVELFQLMMSMLILSRAHEESKTKSFRVSQSWASRRSNAQK
ncbi:recombinase family protein [Methylobacterium goesingense]|uniref:DNA invertase Pin-like site-specific DNA recombinase n=1 Tax=Methylobacterium goesingense TaxID=243690 RepID=A0ABV2L6N2_9HYPH|nr:recombinase family protein [Methylobacterium goesingense]